MREFAIAVWQEADGEVVAGWIEEPVVPGCLSYQVAIVDDVLLHVNVIAPGLPDQLIDAVIEDHLQGIEWGAGEPIP